MYVYMYLPRSPEAGESGEELECDVFASVVKSIREIDNSLHCVAENVSGLPRGVLLSVSPSEKKCYTQQLGSLQPVQRLDNIKIQVFIHFRSPARADQ